MFSIHIPVDKPMKIDALLYVDTYVSDKHRIPKITSESAWIAYVHRSGEFSRKFQKNTRKITGDITVAFVPHNKLLFVCLNEIV